MVSRPIPAKPGLGVTRYPEKYARYDQIQYFEPLHERSMLLPLFE